MDNDITKKIKLHVINCIAPSKLKKKRSEISFINKKTLSELKEEIGLSKEQPYIYIVNGRIKTKEYELANNDEVKIVLPISGG